MPLTTNQQTSASKPAKYRATRGVIIDGGVVLEGEGIELYPLAAAELLAIGQIVPIVDEPDAETQEPTK
jgi:hypothetical protein